MPDLLAVAVEPEWSRLVDLGDDLAILFYPHGTVRFRHRCNRASTGRGVIVCAPGLDPRHTITSHDPLTITPSLLCSDCGTHGFITDGHWVPA